MLALLGLRCSGKTTLGRELARRLGVDFVDLDDALVALARFEAIEPRAASAGELLDLVGEPAFRDLEERALERTLAHPRALVLATGGGVVEREANRVRLAERALCVWLHADLEVLRRRLRADPAPRPALVGSDAADELDELASRRFSWYRSLAALELDTNSASPSALADALQEALDPALRPLYALRGG